jgi:carbon-monoxide dehydrogenase iron sulfur subunit
MKILDVFPDRCTGCQACMLACSFATEGVFSLAKARIRVAKFEEEGVDIPMPCYHCEKAPCLPVCPTRAISRNKETDGVIVNQNKCIVCRSCMIACPFGAIHYDSLQKIIFKCDLCYGDPACVKFCETKAIVYDTPERIAEMKWKAKALEIVETGRM